MQKYFYLVHIQYLGFRFHGWAKQPKVKTLHQMVDKSLKFALGHEEYKSLGSGRTDSKVSANHFAFELFLKEPIDMEEFLPLLNQNLSADIRAIKIEEVDKEFNIINTPKIKEYLYLFSFGEKAHPFAASLVNLLEEDLDIELMKEGALLFEGIHNFKTYCTKPSENTVLEREILVSRIEENKLYTASFFPTKTYAYHIHSKGFMRNQVRLMMGQLIRLGKGEVSLDEIRESLINPSDKHLDYIATASGLMLNKIHFETGE